jgi:SagB-type dehydrogenase family enzyme
VTVGDGVDDEVWAEFERARQVRPRVETTGKAPGASTILVGKRQPAPAARETPLSALLLRRRSERMFTPTTVADVASTLGAVARLVHFDTADDGYQRSWMAYPSAGGRQPFDFAIAAGAVAGLAHGAWYFDPAHLEFVEGDFDYEAALRSAADALSADAPPPAAIFPIANLARTLSRYEAGTSLIWRDAGAVLFALHVRAADLGLASCIVGTCGAVVFDPARGRVDVGAVALGGAASR